MPEFRARRGLNRPFRFFFLPRTLDGHSFFFWLQGFRQNAGRTVLLLSHPSLYGNSVGPGMSWAIVAGVCMYIYIYMCVCFHCFRSLRCYAKCTARQCLVHPREPEYTRRRVAADDLMETERPLAFPKRHSNSLVFSSCLYCYRAASSRERNTTKKYLNVDWVDELLLTPERPGETGRGALC